MNEPIADEMQQRLARLAGPFFISIAVNDWSPELQHALRLLGIPWHKTIPRDGLCSAKLGVGPGAAFDGALSTEVPEGEEGYGVSPGPDGSLVIQAHTEHGLANGLYNLRRSLLSATSGINLRPADLLPAGPSSPAFAQRDTYQYLSPWRLPRLSCDALTVPEWKTHLERMRALNVRRWYFDIWTDQYFHPDVQETHSNQPLYERMKIVSNYAHELGLRTGVYLFPAQIPVAVYLAIPNAHAVEATNYHGINGCLSKAWNEVIRIDTFLISYFGESLDDIVVEMQDPGSCLCPECCRNFPDIVLRILRAYREIPHAGRKISLCTLHFRDWLEEPGDKPTGVSLAVPQLRARVFDALPPETTIVDIDDPTLDMGAARGFRRNYFFFDLDPESGLENQQVFPRVKLRRIETQVRSSRALGHDGLTDYRMMPFTQYVADYVLFRKLWDPEAPLDTILTDLAAELGIANSDRPVFVKALRNIDAWWEDQNLAALRDAATSLETLSRGTAGTALKDLCDTISVLALLGEYLMSHPERVRADDFYPPADLVSSVRTRMLASRIFEAYTVHQHWILRSQETIGQRIRWWLKGIDCELRRVSPPGAV